MSHAMGSQSRTAPVVSVVVPTYNSARYLPETIDTVLSQSFGDLEIIIVDDGSTDNTAEIVAALRSDKIRYIRQENSGGPSRPRNVGIENARGEYIALFDSDDTMLANKLSESVQFLERHPDLGLLFSNFTVFKDAGIDLPGTFLDQYRGFQRLPKTRVGDRWFIIPRQLAYESLFYENFIGTSGVVIPKRVFQRVGRFDERIAGPEDRDMWLRISRHHDIGYLDIVGHRYRQRQTGITGRGEKVLSSHRILVMRKQLETGLPPSLRRQAKRIIAKCLFDLGYHHQSAGNLRQARIDYCSSLRESLSLLALKGLLISSLGQPFLALIRRTATKRSGQ